MESFILKMNIICLITYGIGVDACRVIGTQGNGGYTSNSNIRAYQNSHNFLSKSSPNSSFFCGQNTTKCVTFHQMASNLPVLKMYYSQSTSLEPHLDTLWQGHTCVMGGRYECWMYVPQSAIKIIILAMTV